MSGNIIQQEAETIQVQVRAPREAWRKAKSFAALEGKTNQTLFKECIEAYLEKKEAA